MLKNILGELDSPAGTSSSTSVVAPKPMRSLRKQATESEIAEKNYLDKLGKKAHEKKKKAASDVQADVSFNFLRLF